MDFKNIFKFQFKRVNPFPGLAIDADTWRDAHDYSRNQQRLHNLLFHETGIIQGLEITGNDPPDLSVNVHPGVAVDPEGNIILVRNEYHHQIQNRKKETVYLIIQFREILEGPYQPPEGGQPTRIIDGYRIQERDNLPEEPYLELARIELDPEEGSIRNAENKDAPVKNEINLNYRKEANEPSAPPTPPEPVFINPEAIIPKQKILIGHAANDTGKEMHVHGLRNLAREMEMRYDWTVELEENVALDQPVDRFTMIYLTGGNGFKLGEKEVAVLENFIESNGLLLAEDCTEGVTASNTSLTYGPVYQEIMDKFKPELKAVRFGEPILSSVNVFSDIPQGVKSGVFLMDDNIIYSNNDFGCAWQGGHKGNPISRDAIRGAFEIGANIIDCAYRKKLSVPRNKASGNRVAATRRK